MGSRLCIKHKAIHTTTLASHTQIPIISSSMSSPRVWFSESLSRQSSRSPSDPPPPIVTGASAGFGLAMTQLVLARGDIAVATLRKPSALAHLSSQYPSSRLLVLPVDVTKASDIAAAFAKAKEVFGRVDVVFNNAGYVLINEVEFTEEKDAREIFDVNFFGAANVSREAVRFFRTENPKGAGGHLFQVTSVVGLEGEPAIPYYSAR